MKIEIIELRNMFLTAASLGSKNTLIALGLDKTEISKAEAYRQYSRRTVDQWIKQALIRPIKRGTKVRLNALELEMLSQTALIQKTLNISE